MCTVQFQCYCIQILTNIKVNGPLFILDQYYWYCGTGQNKMINYVYTKCNKDKV